MENLKLVESPSTAISPGPGTVHSLNPFETSLLLEVYGALVNAKARIYDLQAELEIANRTLADAQSAFAGASRAVTGAHGMTRANLSPDFTKITQL